MERQHGLILLNLGVRGAAFHLDLLRLQGCQEEFAFKSKRESVVAFEISKNFSPLSEPSFAAHPGLKADSLTYLISRASPCFSSLGPLKALAGP